MEISVHQVITVMRGERKSMSCSPLSHQLCTLGGKVAAEKNLGRCQGSSSLHGHLIGFDSVAVATPLCAR